MRLGRRPPDEPAGITAVGVDALDGGEARPGPAEHALGAIAILYVCGVDLDCKQAAVGVGQDVPLASVDLLAGVVALASPF
jgi:hypothetical protein